MRSSCSARPKLANLTLLIVATTSAVVTSRAITGNETVFQVPVFVLRSYWEMLTYAAMGAVFGAGQRRVYPLLSRRCRPLSPAQRARLAEARHRSSDRRDGRDFTAAKSLRRLPGHQRVMAGGLELRILAALAVAKFVASSVSLGAGAPGGVFGPIFFIGTMAGGFGAADFRAHRAASDRTARFLRAGRAGRVPGRAPRTRR